ncbi:MAG: sulfur carrier protein ThiS [Lysobacter sp.]|nr:sulfur carrier protein ThiS [Lysobacter sp.]
MKIQLNGGARELDRDSTIGALLKIEGLADRRVAVEVNGEIVARGRHDTHLLEDGDRVEIVHALGGG